MEVTCRDCGQLGNEDPDDPAPNLCPRCYEARLASIGPKFEAMLESLDDPRLFILWFEQALVEIAGETPQYAKLHADELMRRARYS